MSRKSNLKRTLRSRSAHRRNGHGGDGWGLKTREQSEREMEMEVEEVGKTISAADSSAEAQASRPMNALERMRAKAGRA